MRKIVVSGASGVVGSAFLEKAAAESGFEILALTRKAAAAEKTENITWAQTDYSEESLIPLMKDVYAVVHLAGIKGTVKELSGYDGDMHMTENLLKVSGKSHVSVFIYASSRLVYGNPDNIPWKEDTEPEPRSAYGLNKIRCEELCREYSHKYGFRAASVRIAQVLSEKDQMRNMVNVFRDLASEKKQLTVIGRSSARRQYIYSRDLADILLRLLDADIPEYCTVNAGMDYAYTNYEIAEAFNRAYDNNIPVKYDDSAPETITSSIMDVSLMKQLTGCIPRDIDTVLSDMALRQNN